MKCNKCGWDDKGTGDFAHICGPIPTIKTEKNMTSKELYDKLEQAQRLLSDVYNFAQWQNPELARLMSCADTCIVEAFESEWKTND